MDDVVVAVVCGGWAVILGINADIVGGGAAVVTGETGAVPVDRTAD